MSKTPLAASVFTEQLIPLLQGFPIWDPSSGEIADVGYMEYGAWTTLFNASKPPGDPSNTLGTPDGYQQLHVGAVRQRTCLPAKVPIRSESVKQQAVEVALSASPGIPVQAGGGFSFRCSKERGAVLVLGDDADRRDAISKLKFIKYILEHRASWLTFANDVHECGIGLSDLVFLTGCDKTSSWTCAAFCSESSEATVNFTLEQPGISQAGMALSWSWESSSSVLSNLYHPSQPAPRDKCVFMRGYRICDRESPNSRWLKRLFRRKSYDGFESIPRRRRDDTEDPDLGPSRRSYFRSGHDRLESHGSSRGNRGDEGSSKGSSSSAHYGGKLEDQIVSPPAASGDLDFKPSESPDSGADDELPLDMLLRQYKEPNPLDIILNYILEGSTAELALVHDDDLLCLLQSFGSTIDFERRIHETSPKIFIDNQVGMLETTYSAFLLGDPDITDDSNLHLDADLHILSSDIDAVSKIGSTAVPAPAEYGRLMSVPLESVHTSTQYDDAPDPQVLPSAVFKRRIRPVDISRSFSDSLEWDNVGEDSGENYGRIPPSSAAENIQEVARTLLAPDGVETDSKDVGDKSQTPLSWAAADDFGGRVQPSITWDDFVVDSKDYKNRTPLSHAADGEVDEAFRPPPPGVYAWSSAEVLGVCGEEPWAEAEHENRFRREGGQDGGRPRSPSPPTLMDMPPAYSRGYAHRMPSAHEHPHEDGHGRPPSRLAGGPGMYLSHHGKGATLKLRRVASTSHLPRRVYAHPNSSVSSYSGLFYPSSLSGVDKRDGTLPAAAVRQSVSETGFKKALSWLAKPIASSLTSVTLHPLLRSPSLLRAPTLHWDVTRPPLPMHGDIPIAVGGGFGEPATSPPVTYMRLLIPIPGLTTHWAMDVFPLEVSEILHSPATMQANSSHAGRPPIPPGGSSFPGPPYHNMPPPTSVVSTGAVLLAVHRALLRRATEHEFLALADSRRGRIAATFWARCRKAGGEAGTDAQVRHGMRKLDFLGPKTRWEGLSPGIGLDEWVVRLGRP